MKRLPENMPRHERTPIAILSLPGFACVLRDKGDRAAMRALALDARRCAARFRVPLIGIGETGRLF